MPTVIKSDDIVIKFDDNIIKLISVICFDFLLCLAMDHFVSPVDHCF